MSKYSIDFKLKVIREYLEGKTGRRCLQENIIFPHQGSLEVG